VLCGGCVSVSVSKRSSSSTPAAGTASRPALTCMPACTVEVMRQCLAVTVHVLLSSPSVCNRAAMEWAGLVVWQPWMVCVLCICDRWIRHAL
jgi:pectin methylesterase-like acyl-CoA thioesterase